MKRQDSIQNRATPQPENPSTPTSVFQHLTIRPHYPRSISAPTAAQSTPDESFDWTSATTTTPTTLGNMTTILNTYPAPSHSLYDDRIPDYFDRSGVPLAVTSGQSWPASYETAYNTNSYTNMTDPQAQYPRSGHGIPAGNAWQYRVSPVPVDAGFRTPNHTSAYTHADSMSRLTPGLRGSPAIKAEEADNYASAMARSGSYMQPTPVSVYTPQHVNNIIKYESSSPPQETQSYRHSVSSNSSYSSYASSGQVNDPMNPYTSERTKRNYGNESAKYQCELCHKFFQRSYNLKAHMEVHNPARPQPHECEHSGCDKKFVRLADLKRHIDSVHIRDKKYPCHRCGARFTRKDTARRHMEDGCSKRPSHKSRKHSHTSQGSQQELQTTMAMMNEPVYTATWMH